MIRSRKIFNLINEIGRASHSLIGNFGMLTLNFLKIELLRVIIRIVVNGQLLLLTIEVKQTPPPQIVVHLFTGKYENGREVVYRLVFPWDVLTYKDYDNYNGKRVQVELEVGEKYQPDRYRSIIVYNAEPIGTPRLL